MNWPRPILTDSGGFQVWSLAERRKITEQGVTFASPVDGAKVFMGPEESMAVQRALGSDIVMIFDECTPYPATEARPASRWSFRCAGPSARSRAHEGNPVGAVRHRAGRDVRSLRVRSARGLIEIGFDGYAIGGLSVGSPQRARPGAGLPPCPACRRTGRVT